MKLVPASQFSIQQLTSAYNQTRVDYLVPMPMTARRLGEYIADYDVHLDASVVAVERNRILGLCMLGLRGRRGWITRLGVLPGSRRGGLGRAMSEYCIQQAAQRHAKSVSLEVIVGNTPAHQLFLGLGFHEARRLVVLRRPPGNPTPRPDPPRAGPTLTWLNPDETITLAAARKENPAWINQTETFTNAGAIRALHLVDPEAEASGWVSYEQTPLQLRRVLVTLENGTETALARELLYQLHARFATLDTVAENLLADAPYLDAYQAHGYVEAFTRIEMKRVL